MEEETRMQRSMAARNGPVLALAAWRVIVERNRREQEVSGRDVRNMRTVDEEEYRQE
jgi:hypothetical protein